MSSTTKFTIDNEVSCSDGTCGKLRRVVVDPLARAVTHLVVEPTHPRGTSRLVPVALVRSNGAGIQLRCTTSTFDALDDAEETQFLPGATGQWDYGQEQMLSLPYYGLGIGTAAGGIAPGVGGSAGVAPYARTVDRVPTGEVQVRRGEQVHATDGDIGRVRGLVVDPRDHHVTHVLLDEGHLWDKKRVAIPINSVAGVEDGVRLTLTKDEVRDLPPVDLDD